MKLTKTKIEYLDYCWNFYPGCKNGCSYCWAHKRAIRFNKGDFEPRLRPELLLDPLKLKKPSRIGVCFTGDLFGDWVDQDRQILLPDDGCGWIHTASLKGLVFQIINACPQHTFLFLTKQPQNLIKWSPFPENCFVGVTATNWLMFSDALGHLATIQAKVKYISFEPLLERIQLDMLQKMLFPRVINWVIIGQQTPVKKATMPKIEWVREIVEAADKAGIPVFLKQNLYSLWYNRTNDGSNQIPQWATRKNHHDYLRQELP